MKHFNLLNNFRWFATIILLITLSVEQMWGATFTKITSLSNLTEGNYVIVGRQGASSWGILRAGTISSNKLTYTEDYSSTPPATITTTTASEIWYLTVDGTNVKLYNAGQSKYLNPGATSLSYNGSGTNWTAGYSSGFRLGYGTYYLGVNKDANNWCAYVSGSLYSTTYGLTLYKEKCTVTLKDNNETITQATGGASITLPSRSGCDGYTFAGWTKSWTKAQSSWTTTAPTIIPAGSYTPTTNENLYPVYTKTASSSETKSYGWETAAHADWTIGSQPSRSNSTTAHTGSYAGYINTANTYVTFVNKVYVTEFSFWLKRTSTNSNYNVYIETSTDGSSWTAAATYAMNSFGNGTYTQKTKTWDGTKAYYVRFHCYNTTAARYVDDVSITYSVQTTSYISVPACTYSISYHCNDATSNCPDNASGQTALPNSLPAPSKTGYSFDGWYTNEGLTIAATAGATLVSNADLYAKWEEVPCDENPSIGNASLNGSFSLTSVPFSCSVTSEGGTGCSITDAGFVWKSGSDPSASDNKTAGTFSTNITGTIPSAGSFSLGTTYYVKAYATNDNGTAVSSTSYQYRVQSVTYYGNTSTSGSMSTQYVEYNKSTALTSNAFSKTGYTFAGWATSAGGDVAYSNGANVSATDNMDLYAKWNAKQCTVSFNIGEGSGTITSVTATYDQGMPSKESNLPTREGYDFDGFWDGAGGTGTQYYNADGTSKINWDKDVTAAQTLYAKWTVQSYKVTWMVNGEEYTAGGSTSVNYGSHVATLPTAPTPSCGDKFMGWTTTNIGSAGQATDEGLNLFTTAGGAPTISAEGPVTYYAVFADYAD